MKDYIVPVLLAILTGIVGYTSYMASTKANRETAKVAAMGVDAAAFERAKDIYLSALETARADLKACREDLISTRGDLQAARNDMRELRESNERLSTEVAALRVQLASGIN